jgi:hypothetical protein
VAETTDDLKFPNVRYVDAANDEICGIAHVDYLLYETDWTGSGDYNADLSTIVFTGSVENYITLAPIANDQIRITDSSGNTCDLENLGEIACLFEFKMYYRTMNTTLSTVIAKADITIGSECAKAAKAANLVDIWFWNDTFTSSGSLISEEDIMYLGFSLQQGQADGTGIIDFILPYIRPTLGTDTDFDSILDKCGQIEYKIIDIDDPTITVFTYPSDSYGVVSVDADTVNAAF